MINPKHIKIADYSYALPDERIAKYPLPERDHSKLLIYNHGQVSDDHFYNLPQYLPSASLMVFNNTKVIQARLRFHKPTGAAIEVFLLEPAQPADYEQMFQSRGHCSWHCMIGNLKKWHDEPLTLQTDTTDGILTLTASRSEDSVITDKQKNTILVNFDWSLLTNKHPDTSVKSVYTDQTTVQASSYKSYKYQDSRACDKNFAEVLEVFGQIPIPPYLGRDTEPSDNRTYQTVYSKIKGSVAAPTAGLHFTDRVLQAIDGLGIDREETTLHVGAGTFKPVKSVELKNHEMHTEHIAVKRSLIEKLLAHDCHAIAVGTTSVRTLETLYYIGVKLQNETSPLLHVTQWEPYETAPTLSVRKALEALLRWYDHEDTDTLHATTQIIIAPGYDYKIVNALVTNFHQPQSTLLLLVDAFVRGDWRTIYRYALSHDFRFLSYGDSSLLIP